ncbi:uncharacterized protein [Apostichopus japonicus]|uniref:uncharacterized protein n=1 Tax=Stichopus japonicus TaxID=307972 RepID=UPI003AB714F8
MTSLRDGIEATDRKIEELFGNGDLRAMSQLYTEDCKTLPAGHPMGQGREGAAKAFQHVYDKGMKKVKIVEEEIGPAGGDLVYSRGVYTLFRDDGTVGDKGKFIALWKRINGQMYMYMDIFNSDSHS